MRLVQKDEEVHCFNYTFLHPAHKQNDSLVNRVA